MNPFRGSVSFDKNDSENVGSMDSSSWSNFNNQSN
jgi:hypothetical protein